MRIQFLGCGDAFGSGGRFNTCFHVVGDRVNFLIDCGATSLVAMKKFNIDRNAVDTILLTHFHADHVGGIPFFMLEAQLTKRDQPLTIAGPPGLTDWFARAMEVAFPGAAHIGRQFPLTLCELEIGRPNDIGLLRTTPIHVCHDDRAGPCLAYRVRAEGRTIAYSGDTEWTDALIAVGAEADLFICECYMREKPATGHMALSILKLNLPTITAKRIILTHMSEDMLAGHSEVPYEMAEDGMVIELVG